MREHQDAPPYVVEAVRSQCQRLPEAHEEQAWVGTRWLVRKKTFAHVLTVEDGWPPAYARAASTDGPLCLLTFRSSGQELERLRCAPYPFFAPIWWDDIIGVVLNAETDWEEISELLTESYCALAPKKLVALVDRPG